MPWEVLKDPNAPQNDLSTERLAIHAALVETTDGPSIVYFDGVFGEIGTRRYRIQDKSIDSTLPTAPSGEHVFCSGHALLADGRWLIGGGVVNQNVPHGADAPETAGHDSGERRCYIYHPLDAKWDQVQDLNFQPDSADNPRGGGRWYPTLLTLETGEVLAVGGHPFAGKVIGQNPDKSNIFDLTGADDYIFSGDQTHRHNNNTAERYTVASNEWTLLTAESTSNDNHDREEYPRVHLAPSGHVFFSTLAKGNRRFFDPNSGTYLAKNIEPPGFTGYFHGSAATSVLLPILMTDLEHVWVLACGDITPQRINIAADVPEWSGAESRGGWFEPGMNANVIAPVRNHACAVILPTGDIFVSGGVGEANAATGFPQGTSVRVPEIYHPPIDWTNGKYTSAPGNWTALIDEPANVVRGYHSVALLLPDGSVWTAGSTDKSGGDNVQDVDADGNPTFAVQNDMRVEIFKPTYFNQQAQRPTISNAPRNIGYGYTIRFNTQANSIQRVLLMRCGSVTHALDADQRMVSVEFDKIDANTIEVLVPFTPPLLPPGRYMLWVVNNQGLPCQSAPLIRVCKQKAIWSVDVDKFSKAELDAHGAPLTYDSAVYIVYDSFLPGEVEQPTLSLVWKSDGANVLDEGITLTFGTPKYEGGITNQDIAQRIVYPVHVTFTNDAAYNAVPEDPGFREILLTATMRHYTTQVPLTLTRKLNPRMSDGDPNWLSTDLRAFSTRSTASAFTAGIANPADGGDAIPYIQNVLATYNDWASQHPNEQHPFEKLPKELIEDQLPLYSHDGNDAIFNFAVARVRFRAPDGVATDTDVRLFFRLWTTGWTALEYSTSTAAGSYPRDGVGPTATPRLGLYGGEINTIPCFAEPRQSILSGQHDPINVRPLVGAGADEVHAYFGCWLDTNQDAAYYPLKPDPNSAGPYADALPIRDLTRGLHQCLVAEIHWQGDPINPGDTPASSDNLAQRNLLYDEAPNPGGFASHLVHHTFELKPSLAPFPPHTLAGLGPQISAPTVGHAPNVPADELVIDWGNLPRDSHVVFYMPQVDVDAVLRYASQRHGPANLSKAGDHAIRCKVTDIGFIPIPGALANTIAGLVSVQLPPNIKTGQKFSIVLRQVSGGTKRVLGATQFDIRVKTEAQILPRLTRNLSVLKYIAQRIPTDNRWYPVFSRYLEELGDRVRSMGVDPNGIAPTTTGSGKRDDWPYPFPDTGGHVGSICELIYDGCGRFQGFVLEECRWKACCTSCLRRLWCCLLRLFCRPCGKRSFYKTCDGEIEAIARRACAEHRAVTVYPDPKDRHAVFRLIMHCCC